MKNYQKDGISAVQQSDPIERGGEIVKSQPAEKPKKSIKKKIGTLLFILLNVGIIAVTAFLEFSKDASNVESIPFLGLNFSYLLAAAGCIVVVLTAETCKYVLMMKKLIGKVSLKTAFQVTVIGKYYDNITPLGAGGQPFQIYHLSKQGLPKGASASMPIAAFLTMQVAFGILALIVFFFNGSVISSVGVRIAAYIGLLFYLFLPMAIVLFTVAPKTAGKIIGFFIRLLGKIRIIKDVEKSTNSTMSSMSEYRDCIMSMYSKRFLLISLLGLSLIYQLAMCSLPFFVLRAFGGATTWVESFSICIFIYAAITFVPTPGNAGAAEGSFYALFSDLTSSYLFWAMLVWRFFCYYIFIALGAGVFGYNAIRSKINKRKSTAGSARKSNAET